ncbi:MAG: PAS domain S-box protein [Deltaproteobacteria bacterium]|nr:PAS domain S-box protein [Deltaproteobacteria bacterium]
MSDRESRDHSAAEEAAPLLELTELAVQAEDLEGLARRALPGLMRVMGATAVILSLEEPKPPFHSLFQEGIQAGTLPLIKRICTEQFQQVPIQDDALPIIVSLSPKESAHLFLFSLRRQTKNLGFLGVVLSAPEKLPRQSLMRQITGLLAYFIGQFLDRLAYDQKIAHLNTYLAVSSKIAQSFNLREVIEAVLYSSKEAVAAEAASVLLLDSEKKNFRFYGVEGPAKPVLLDVTFPVDQGLAGYVFQTQKSAIFNEVQQHPRFYGKVDSVSGFQTKNLVAIPLAAGDEKIGVLEVLNKAGGEPFYEEDRLLLESIAEEIAFAIRNANTCEEKQTLSAEIRRMLEFQTKLIQTSNDGIIANDQHGNIVIFNEGAERVLGYRPDEVIGKIKVTQLYPSGVAQEVRAKIDGPEYGGPGRLIHYETVGLSKTGEQIPVELSASLILGNDREVTAVGFFRDLRERRQLQEKLLQSERLAALGQMAAHISHEVKNPLVVIGGIARQVLKAQGGGPSKSVEKLRIIVEEIRRLEEFLAEVGSFAKLSEPRKCPIDLNSLIREMCLKLEATLQESRIKLAVNLDPNLPQVQFDPLLLRQVLLNIAKNGIEAMPVGGTLTLASGRDSHRVSVRISDSGEGIHPDSMDKIFRPFYSTKPKGSGLGLAISQAIVTAHQGEIRVESELHRGTGVTVFLQLEST